ncbi:MAG: sugar phosphorylase [Chloroflexota bacterium]|nr:sugar phosphorylase [Chloroflexota bacterium]
MIKPETKLLEHLNFLYGENNAPIIYAKLIALLKQFKQDHPNLVKLDKKETINEKDIILITYGDMVRDEGKKPLKTLGRVLKEYLVGLINTVHILPFYPFSSDDGFAVIDYRHVNPDFGSWSDISHLNQVFRLMFDAVINHCSTQSAMFQGFLRCDPDKANFFTTVESDTDLSKVFRPRATPVVTPFMTNDGEKLVWTTFSADQVDLNFKNPDVLIEMIDIILFYVLHGAEFIRFDAVTYVWKELGTNCINLPQTHRFVQLMRTVLDLVAANVVIITETNIPHKDNIAYFGDGTNEAQLVYNFALPLLTLHSFISGNINFLSDWAETLDLPSHQTTFFNFLACHDGIGMLPVKGILPESEVEKVVQLVKARGGFISYKSNEDGTKSPYELNINFLDAICTSDSIEKNKELAAKRFLASHAIMLSLRGVPGIYFHSLFGSRNWREGVVQTGRYRTINRQKLNINDLIAELSDANSIRHIIFKGFSRLLKIRREDSAFHPFGKQKILHIHPSVFSLIRISPHKNSKILCLHNIGGQSIELAIELQSFGIDNNSTFKCILTNAIISPIKGFLKLKIKPYEILWLKY